MASYTVYSRFIQTVCADDFAVRWQDGPKIPKGYCTRRKSCKTVDHVRVFRFNEIQSSSNFENRA